MDDKTFTLGHSAIQELKAEYYAASPEHKWLGLNHRFFKDWLLSEKGIHVTEFIAFSHDDENRQSMVVTVSDSACATYLILKYNDKHGKDI